MEIKVLHRQGKSIRQISRLLGVSRNTVRRRLRAKEAPVAATRSRKVTKLDEYRGYLQMRIASARPDWIPATVLSAVRQRRLFARQTCAIMIKIGSDPQG